VLGLARSPVTARPAGCICEAGARTTDATSMLVRTVYLDSMRQLLLGYSLGFKPCLVQLFVVIATKLTVMCLLSRSTTYYSIGPRLLQAATQ
jgi:hypothetical protein